MPFVSINYCILVHEGLIQGGWMGWLATHHELYYMFLLRFNLRRTDFQNFPGGEPQTPIKSMLSVQSQLSTPSTPPL